MWANLLHGQPGWSAGQAILNNAGAREPEHLLDPPVPVVARIQCGTVLANGPMAVTDVKKATDAAGHGWRTVVRAAERLRIIKRPVSGEAASASRPGSGNYRARTTSFN